MEIDCIQFYHFIWIINNMHWHIRWFTCGEKLIYLALFSWSWCIMLKHKYTALSIISKLILDIFRTNALGDGCWRNGSTTIVAGDLNVRQWQIRIFFAPAAIILNVHTAPATCTSYHIRPSLNDFHRFTLFALRF